VVDYDHDIFLRTTQVKWFNPVSTLFKTLSYTYDDASNRASMTGAEGEVVSYSYDANNLLTAISRQKGTSSAQFLSIAYDAGNRRRSMTFGNGVTETFVRDIKGQILRLLHTRSDGSVVSSVSYTYDDMGTRKSMSWDHLGVTGTFGYDGLYRLIAESWSGNRGQVGYVNVIGSNIGNESGYSPVGKGTPAALTEVAAHYQDYTFDRWGNRLSLNGNSRTASVSYDNENRINQETPGTMSKITGTTAAASDTESGYNPSKANDGDITDAANSTYAWRSQDVTGQHWLEISWASAKTVKQVRVYVPTSPGTVQRFKVQYWDGFAWVDASVLTAVNATASGGWYSTSYHENLFRITPVSTTKVRYLQDSGGGASGSPNIAWLNELEAYEETAGSVVTYTHDSNGNVTKRQTDANNFEDFAYDYANRLNLYKKTVSGSLTVHYTYLAAPTGDRFRKRNELATGGTIQDYQFVFDARDCVADYEKPANGSLAFVRDYVQGLDIDSKIARVESDGTARFYAGDALGSVTHLLDSAAAVLNTTLTNAWGESMVTSQPTADRFGFTQRENDSESSLMHYRARWYDPRLGRFGGKDPFNMLAHYAYAGNAPLNRVDPDGLQDSPDASVGESPFAPRINQALDAIGRLLGFNKGEVNSMKKGIEKGALDYLKDFATGAVDRALAAGKQFREARPQMKQIKPGSSRLPEVPQLIPTERAKDNARYLASKGVPADVAGITGTALAAAPNDVQLLFHTVKFLLGETGPGEFGYAVGYLGTGLMIDALTTLAMPAIGEFTSGALGPTTQLERFQRQAAINRRVGPRVQSDFAAHLRKNGMKVVGEKVHVQTPFGRREIDIVIEHNGKYYGLEIKSGRGRGVEQFSKDRWINLEGAEFVGERAEQLGLKGKAIEGTYTVTPRRQ
jgi:RHS repeat-associated protein